MMGHGTLSQGQQLSNLSYETHLIIYYFPLFSHVFDRFPIMLESSLHLATLLDDRAIFGQEGNPCINNNH